MIIETSRDDFAALLLGRAPGALRLADTPVASHEVLQMLSGLAEQIGEAFSPAAWLLVEDDEIVGLCSVVRPPQGGVVEIGYGVAPSRRGRGVASRAVCDLVAWARTRADVLALTAETSTANPASQKALAAAGFVAVGERIDEEDGPLICWRCPVD
jgi:RimJ/RimL family protein N-acetyltransferase